MADNSDGSLFIAKAAADCQTESIDSCPDKGLYKRLLLWDQTSYNVDWEHPAEISEAFHRRTTDANPHVAGLQEFPYKDNVTNLSTHGRMLAVERRSNWGPVQNNAIYGADASGPSLSHTKLALEYKTDGETKGDIDRFTLFARAGEHYLVETHNGGSLVADTKIDLRDKWGAGPVSMCLVGGVSNSACLDDDGGEGLYSKLEFVPTTTGWYRLSVWPYSVNGVGISKVYQVRYTLVDDDYGDSRTRANPASVAPPSATSGNLGTISPPAAGIADEDWVYFYYPGKWLPSQLTFLFCHYSTNPITWQVYTATGATYGQEWVSAVCGSELPVTYPFVAAGFYFIRIKAVNSASSANFNFSVRRTACTAPHTTDCSDLDYENDSCGAGPAHECNAIDMDAIETGVTPYWMVRAGFEKDGDVDWYKFHANRGEIWAIETSSLTGGANTRIEARMDNALYTGGGGDEHLVASANAKSYPNSEASLLFVIPSDGEYYVTVTNAAAFTTYSEYSIVFRYNGIYNNYMSNP